MKFVVVAVAVALLSLTGARAETIKVGVTAGIHGQIIEVVKKNAAEHGLDIQIVEFNEYIQPDAALAAGDIQANCYQHKPFLQSQIKARGYDLVPVGKVALFPIAFFSKRIKSVADLPVGGRVALPNDPSNEARTLLLLETAGVIELRPGIGFAATPLDVTENPKQLKFVELEAAQLARAIQDVDMGAVNTNYALQGGLDLVKDVVLREDLQSQYIVEIVVRRQDAELPWVKTLVASYQQDNVKAFIEKSFQGAVIPAW